MTNNYTEFYTEYSNKLFLYLMRMSGDYEVSRDIMQESFTRHYQHYGNNTAVAPSALFTIARNALIDYLRKQSRARKLDRESVPQFAIDEEQSFIIQEEMQQVMEAVKKLPDDDREILSMAVSGLAYKHIAEVLGLSETNTKIKIHRTRMKLRQIMSKGEK